MTIRPQIQELGLPLIRHDNINLGGSRSQSHVIDITRLLGQNIITTFVFLIIIIWFTLALNASTREQIDTDYFLLQFTVYFTIIIIFVIIFIILLIT